MGERRWDGNEVRTLAKGQRRAVGRAEGSPAPLAITVALEIQTPSLFLWQATVSHHLPPIVPPPYTGHLLYPGPGSIQIVPLMGVLA